jgi:protoheme IX farnesyltransferase
MSTATQPVSEAQAVLAATPIPHRYTVVSLLRDYFELTKARVTSLVIMAAWCGFYLACLKSGVPSLGWKLFNALLGIALVSGGAAAMNQVFERDLDALMLRTCRRPLPAQRMGVMHASIVGIGSIAFGILYLGFTTNWLAAALSAFTAAMYLGAYTPLKRHTPVCTFVGAFPGAMPPVLGWAAARGSLSWEAAALFAIVFAWQFPHFHSIAWLYREDYERANIRMLAVLDRTGGATIREILIYSLLLIPISVAPAWLHLSGTMYVVGAFILSVAFFWFGVRLAALKMPPSAPHSKARARQLLQASVFYLPLLFALMMLNAIS